MNEASPQGQWEGHFTYGEGYTAAFQEKKVRFALDIQVEDGVLTGYSTDSRTQGLFKEPAKIEGRVDGDSIAFIKRYPCLVTSDQDGNSILVPEQPSLDIIYAGKLHKSFLFNRYYLKGSWKITGSIPNRRGQMVQYVYRGDWKVKRVKGFRGYKLNEHQTRASVAG